MKIGKTIFKSVLFFLSIPLLYFVVALIFSFITVNGNKGNQLSKKIIYLNSNGVHLDIVVPLENIDSLLLSGLKRKPSEKYLSFGWGDENFYVNTPTWADLTIKNAFVALFLDSPTIIHLTRYIKKREDWVEIKISELQLSKLNFYLQNSFKTNENGDKIILKNISYASRDNFYKANGSYSLFKTCNSWVNSAFKESDLKACLWTPFDFTLMDKHR